MKRLIILVVVFFGCISPLQAEKKIKKLAIIGGYDQVMKYPDWAEKDAAKLAQLIDKHIGADQVVLYFSYIGKPHGPLGFFIAEWEKLKGKYVNIAQQLAEDTVKTFGLNANVDELDILTIGELYNKSDMMLVLPGGIRTFSQLTFVTTFLIYPLDAIREKNKQLLIYNRFNFWEGYINQLIELQSTHMVVKQLWKDAKDYDPERKFYLLETFYAVQDLAYAVKRGLSNEKKVGGDHELKTPEGYP
ncbi:MAG: hypothetical protein S4CHLAM102_15780 [Chlamydiia bacterium]|nr:hypothetical protein [Chlamydiia bacterium]